MKNNTSGNITPDRYLPYSIALALCSLLGGLLSAGAVFVILYCRKLRKRTSNKFLVNLFVADSCVSFLMVLFNVKEWSEDTPANHVKGVRESPVFHMLITTFMLLSLMNRTMVSVDRLLAVTKPFFYKEKFTTKLVVALSVLQGVIAMVYVTVILVGEELLSGGLLSNIIHISFIVFATIGFLALTISNAIIYREAKKQIEMICKLQIGSSVKCSTASEHLHRVQSREFRIVRTYLAMIALFVLCWTPFLVVVVCDHAMGKTPQHLMFAVLYPLSLNYILDPVIYVGLSKDVKVQMKHTFCKRI